MTPQDPFNRAGWYGWGIVAFLLILLPLACSVSHAQEPRQLTPNACHNLSQIVVAAAEARDTGARHQAYAALIARRFDRDNLPEEGRRIVLREIKRVFTSNATAEELELDVFTRCMTGLMGGTET